MSRMRKSNGSGGQPESGRHNETPAGMRGGAPVHNPGVGGCVGGCEGGETACCGATVGRADPAESGGGGMSERPTPETDAVEYLISIGRKNDQWVVRSDVIRKLERERDEAREAFVIATDQMVQAQCQVREASATIEDAKRALNATDFEGILLASLRVKEERDEAREIAARLAHFLERPAYSVDEAIARMKALNSYKKLKSK